MCIYRIPAKAAILGLAFTLAGSAFAAKEGKTIVGSPFITGGIGSEEQASLKNGLPQYSLWIQTATKAGPYVSDASVKITDKAGTVVLDTELDGPWLMVKLPLGEYKVAVTHGNKTEQRSTQIHTGDHHTMVFYFDERADVVPKGQEP